MTFALPLWSVFITYIVQFTIFTGWGWTVNQIFMIVLSGENVWIGLCGNIDSLEIEMDGLVSTSWCPSKTEGRTMNWLLDKPLPAAVQKVINHLVAASPGPCVPSPHPIDTPPQGRHAPLTQSSLCSESSKTDVLESNEREESWEEKKTTQSLWWTGCRFIILLCWDYQE